MTGGFWRSLILSIVLVLPTAQVEAARIHAILVASSDNDIAPGPMASVQRVDEFFKFVAQNLGIEYSPTFIQDNAFERARIERALNEVSLGNDDVLVFYYSGHGFRSQQNMPEKFPAMYVPDARSGSYSGLRMIQVRDALARSRPRLLIVLVDSCNNFVPGIPVPDVIGLAPEDIPKFPKLRDSLVRLFLNSRGEILATGAQPGEFGVASRSDGGLFTTQLINAVYGDLFAGEGRWTTIAEEAEGTIQIQSMGHAQRPIIELRLGPGF